MAPIGNIVFTCEDPARMASFWADALGYGLQKSPKAYRDAWLKEGGDPNASRAVVDPEGRGPRLFFTKGESTPPDPQLPAAIQLDLSGGDREVEVARLAALGARVIRTCTRQIGPYVEAWTLMADPEGNIFSVSG